MFRIVAVMLLVGCGPAWSGKVSGYTLQVNEALYATLDDDKGAAVGAVVVLGDQTGLCALLAATKAPPSATIAAFTLTRQADGKLLSPDVGDYIVGASSSASASAAGAFLHTDANGTNSIPSTNRFASSGLLKVTELSNDRGSMSMQFEGKFGAQNDSVSVAVRAQRCIIDRQTLSRGFLATTFGGSSSGPPPSSSVSQSPECADFLACYEATYPGQTASIQSSYGPNGTCWTGSSATADSCTNACRSGLTSLRQSSTAGACYQ